MKKLEVLISKIFILFFIGILTVSCKQKIETASEYFSWINNTTNGCVIVKDKGKVTFVMKYLHPDYLAYRECVRKEKIEYDSLRSIYNQSRTFVFSLKNSDLNGMYDVLYVDANNPQEYNRRLQRIQYDMASSFYIKNGELDVYPKLCATENNYGLSAERQIILVFDQKMCQNGDGKIKICYEDKIFGSGFSEFVFDLENLDDKLRFDFI